MANRMSDQPQEALLQRIDAIARELEMLRQSILHPRADQSNGDLAQQLYGALGQGTWDEYDQDLDWQRFGA